MTKITFFKKNNLFLGFKVEGHSGYSEAGTDIVCSAVSMSTQMTAVALKNVLKLNVKVEKDEKRAFLNLRFAKNATSEEILKSQPWFETLKISLEDVAKDFKKYLSLEVKDEIN